MACPLQILKGDGGPARALVRGDLRLDLGFGVAGLLVELLDFLRVGEKLPFVERFANAVLERLAQMQKRIKKLKKRLRKLILLILPSFRLKNN